VKVAALAAGVPVLQPESLKDEATQAALAALSPEVIVVAAYGKILPKAVLALPRRGCLNVHASLLPRWRGASPIAAAILAGDAQSGVSIMEMAAKMDAGPVISQGTTPIAANDTTGTLETRLAGLGAELLVETLPSWLAGDAIAVPQEESQVTFCWTLAKNDAHLKVAMTPDEAERAVRAYDPWPGAFVLYGGERLGVWRAHTAPGPEAATGAMTILEKRPAIALRGGWLVLDEVQRAGSKRVTGEQFLNGARGVLLPEVGLA
jgi:methionyl-tRNA formyltransferase